MSIAHVGPAQEWKNWHQNTKHSPPAQTPSQLHKGLRWLLVYGLRGLIFVNTFLIAKLCLVQERQPLDVFSCTRRMEEAVPVWCSPQSNVKHHKRTSYRSNRAGKLPPGKEKERTLSIQVSPRGMKQCIRVKALLIRLKLCLISCCRSSAHKAEAHASLVTNLRAV